MDAAELEQLSSTLIKAIADARALAAAGDSPAFREVLRHAHDMHELLLEAIRDHEALITAHVRTLARTTGDAIAELDAFLAKVDGKMR